MTHDPRDEPHYEGPDYPPWTPAQFIGWGRLHARAVRAGHRRPAGGPVHDGDLTDHDDAARYLGLTNASDSGHVLDLTATRAGSMASIRRPPSWRSSTRPSSRPPRRRARRRPAVLRQHPRPARRERGRDAQRQDEDFTDDVERRLGLTPQSADARLARALDRVARGTYVPATPGYDPDAGIQRLDLRGP